MVGVVRFLRAGAGAKTRPAAPPSEDVTTGVDLLLYPFDEPVSIGTVPPPLPANADGRRPDASIPNRARLDPDLVVVSSEDDLRRKNFPFVGGIFYELCTVHCTVCAC